MLLFVSSCILVVCIGGKTNVKKKTKNGKKIWLSPMRILARLFTNTMFYQPLFLQYL
jgi:hypothetical protein